MANNPGLESQSSTRTTFRIAGIVLVGVGLVMVVLGFTDLVATMNTDSFEGPEHFWMAFVGLPLLAVGGWCLQAGFVSRGRLCAQCGSEQGSAARFCSGCGTALA